MNQGGKLYADGVEFDRRGVSPINQPITGWSTDWAADLARFGESVQWRLPADLLRKFARFANRRLEANDATYQALRRDYEAARVKALV